MYQRILVAIDGSKDASKAADTAIDMAKRSGASLYVLTVVHNPVFAQAAQGAPAPQPIDKAREDAEGYLKAAVSRAEAQGIKVRGEIIENVPSVVDAIDDYAEEWKIELIVVGTRGLSGLKKILMGSVSSALVSKAPCSILVVR